MRAFAVSLSKKSLAIFFAAVLAIGLVPVQALAATNSLQSIPEGSEGAVPVASSAEEEGRDVLALPSDASSSADGDGADSTSEDVVDTNTEPGQDGFVASDDFQGDAAADDGSQAAVPAAGVINQTMPLEVVAQQESTRSYFLAQTLESTKTVPIVSANLPLDTSANQGPQAGADGGTTVGSEDKVTDGDPSASAEGEGSSEDEGGDDSDESDLGTSDGTAAVPGVSSESTVVGSFTYLGMTFAVEPGGESVALVAVDYSKLPEGFVQKQILVVPDAATPDGMDHYSVTRIATDAFSSLTKDNANPDYTGCIELFSDEELLAEAGIDPADVAEFLPQGDAAAAADDGQDADASSDIQAKAEAFAYENQETDDGSGDGIRTIVSMDGNVATLDDGSTYTFANPLEGCTGILALGIPASVTSIEDDAFAGADTLQYVVVSEGNPEYASFDGALYSADMTNLRLIPEGRVGAVRVASSATGVDPEVFSHCPSVDALVADAESELHRQYGIRGLCISPEDNTLPCSLGTLFEKLDRESASSHYSSSDVFNGIPTARLSSLANPYEGPTNYSVSGNGTLVAQYDMQIDGQKQGALSPYTWTSLWEGSARPENLTNHKFAYKDGLFRTMRTDGINLDFYTYARQFSMGEPDSGVRSVLFSTSPTGPFTRAVEGTIYSSSVATYFLLNTGVIFWASSGGSIQGTLCLTPDSVTDTITFPSAIPNKDDGFGLKKWTFEAIDGTNTLVKKDLSASTTSVKLSDLIDFEYQDRYHYKFTAEFSLYYPVSWHGNGGSGHTDICLVPPSDASLFDVEDDLFRLVSSETDFKKFNTPVRDGWIFDGWYADEACTDPLDYGKYGSPVTDNSTNKDYYAKWKSIATWDANGGVNAPASSEVTSTSYVEGAENRAGFVAPAAPVAPAGWEFAGWADTAEPRAGETLVQPGETVYNHLLTDEAKAGNPTFYARYKAEVSFDASRGADGDTGLADMPATRTVYAKAPVDGAAPVGELSASEIANAASQKWYRFLGYKATPSAESGTPGATVWYRYGTQGEDGFSLDLPEGTVAPATAADLPGADDETASYADDMAFTVRGDTVFTLLWAPIAYTAAFDAGASEHATAPGDVAGNGDWSVAADPDASAAGATSRKWSYAYTYDMDAVALPNPVLAGYTYDFTSDSGSLLGGDAASALETMRFDAKAAARAADPAGTGASPRTLSFAVTWTKSPYEVRVIDNVSPAASGAYAFGATGAHLTTIGFDGANGIVIPELHPASTRSDGQAYFDDDRMASFSGWTIGRLNGGTTVSGTPRSHTIALSDIDSFFAAYGTTLADGSIVVYAVANFTLRAWTATIELPSDAKTSGTWPGWPSGFGNGAVRTYDCTTADFTLPDNTAITRFGYTFDAWNVVAKKADGTEVGRYTIVSDDGVFAIPANTAYALTLSPVWTATTSLIQLDAGATDAVLAGDTAFSIAFGQRMTEGTVGGGSAANLVEPTRPGHAFLGYFDEAGQQYLTASLGSARTWNKVATTADTAFTLTARWQSDDLDGDGEADAPSSTVRTPAGGSSASVRSTDTALGTAAGAPANVLVGTYNGVMQWNSAAAYPRAFDTVVVNVSSYTLGANNTAADIRAAFGESPAEKRWILGFTVGSQGSYVPFYDIIYGNAVTLALTGADLVRTDDPKAPNFTVDPAKVKVVWTDTDPGYGDGSDPSKNPAADGIAAGDVIVNVFDAGQGAFEDADGNAVRVRYETTTVSPSYNGTTDVETKYPAVNPVLPGYEFLGWSAVPQAQHEVGDAHFKKNTGTPPAITSRATKIYYAHWAPHSYTVAVSGNYDGASVRTTTLTYGQRAEKQDVSGISREGYVCVGFFDTPAASGGTLYLDREGSVMRAWDKGKKTDPQPGGVDFTLYARWVSTSVSGDGEADPTNPPSTDPFPGVPGDTTVVPTTPDNHSVYVSARDGRGGVQTVFDGIYEGVFRFRQTSESATPDSTASVQVMMNYYEPVPGGYDARAEALAAVQKAFEDNANSTTDKYLQGFRVVSTGDFISWADIVAGASIDIDCKGSDLAGDTIPASFRMEGVRGSDHVLVAVYGATPCVDPDDGETTWPVKWPAAPATEVRVTFDAGVGRFADGTRFLDVRCVYGGTVVLPSGASDLELPEGKAPGYKPTEGWSFDCWVDASGAKVTEATPVSALSGTVYYAKYKQKTHELAFDWGGAADGGDVAGIDGTFYIGGLSGRAPAAIQPYDGQPFRASDFGYPMPSDAAFSRSGYDFLGWFDANSPASATTAYAITDAGAALMLQEDGALSHVELIGTDVTMTDETNPGVLYALWAPKSYAVVWHYNYPAYSVGDEQYPATSGEADVYRRGLGANERLRYGQRVDASLLEGPAGARYEFDWWMEGPESNADPVDGANASFRAIAGTADELHFTPVRFVRDDGENRTDYYARWNTGAPIEYTVRLFPGKGGSYSGAQQWRDHIYSFNYPDYELPTVDNKSRTNFPQTTPGYKFLYWQEADASGEALEDGAQASVVKTSEGGDRYYVAVWSELPYKVELAGASELNPVVYNRAHADSPLDWTTWTHDFDVDSKTMWRLPTVAQMNELNALSGFPYEGKRFTGWRLNGADMTDGAFDTAKYLDGFKDDYRKATDALIEAVWEDKVYTVVFSTVTPGSDGTEAGDKQLDNQVHFVSYDATDKVTLPIPVLHSSSGVFSHWDTTVQGTDNPNWVAGVELSIADIFDTYSYSETKVTPQRPVTGTIMNGERAGEAVTDEPMENVITLYTVWNGAHHADVPLNVGIAIDPDTGDMIFADNGYLATSNVDEQAVVVEGLTYEMAGAGEVGGGTAAVFGPILERTKLTVSIAREGSEHEAHLEVPLSIVPFQLDRTALADIESFDADHRLNIAYGLDFGVEDPEGAGKADLVKLLQQIRSSLPDKTVTGSNGWSKEAYPIAKLYYTIGLAR